MSAKCQISCGSSDKNGCCRHCHPQYPSPLVIHRPSMNWQNVFQDILVCESNINESIFEQFDSRDIFLPYKWKTEKEKSNKNKRLMWGQDVSVHTSEQFGHSNESFTSLKDTRRSLLRARSFIFFYKFLWLPWFCFESKILTNSSH